MTPRRRTGPVRFGVVGLGYWGPNLARNLGNEPRAELAWLCDIDEGILASVASRYPHASVTTDVEEMVADPELDAVVVATPVSTHYDLATLALDAGKHVFVEKPLTASSAEAVDLTARAARRGLVLMPGHTFLYSPPVLKIKELIDAGELGDLYFISMSRVNLGLHQPDVSVVWDLGPHDFSILRFWLDELPSEVSAMSRACVFPDTPDVAFVNVRYPNGTVAHLELSWLSPSKLRRTAIVGSEKMVVYDDTSTEPVRIFDSGAALPDPETFGEYRLSYRTGDIISPKIEATEPLALELADFLGAILDGTPLRSSPEIGLDVVRTIEAVDRSLAASGAATPVLDADRHLSEDLGPTVVSLPVRQPPEDTSASGEGDGSVGTAVLGAGPAGLTAAYVLAHVGARATIFEADGVVGGISRTVVDDGFRFDLGGHRFFTKLEPVERLWQEMLGEELVARPRLSRIFYGGKYFSYPLEAKDVVGRLGLWEAVRCAFSYVVAQRHRRRDATTFQEWVTQRFGRRLYDAFFRSYTHKVWGIPGSEIRSLWAAQRIKNFSMMQALLSIVGVRRSHVTTLIEEFRYPRRGPGQMWEAFAEHVEEHGIPVRLNSRVSRIRHRDGRVHAITVDVEGPDGTASREHAVDAVLSSLPLSALVKSLDPVAPVEVRAAADALRYRDLVLVALMTTEEEPFPDNWIYLHDPETRAGRVQNYGAWSKDMVRPGTTCLGVEYFCFQGDEIWEMPEDEAIEMAARELERIGLIDARKVFGGAKVHVPRAYPMYDATYEENVAVIREYLETFENLRTFGRNGLHRYNNQDHSMWTAALATINQLEGASYDVWAVNTEAVYLEEGEAVEHAFDLRRPDRSNVEDTTEPATAETRARRALRAG